MGCGEGILRCLLFIFNGALLGAGIALVVVGGIAGNEFREYADDDLFDDKYLWGPVALAIVVGILLFFVGLTGIGGICCKNNCMLKGYVAFLIILIILEIVLCILAFVYRDEGEDSAKKSMKSVVRRVYTINGTSSTRDTMDKLQREFDCCGGNGQSDYTEAPAIPFPQSCCISSPCQSQNATLYYTKGCAKALFDDIAEYEDGLFAVAIVFAILQIVGFIMACKFLKEGSD